MNISRRLVAGTLGVVIALGLLALPVRCSSGDSDLPALPASIDAFQPTDYHRIEEDADPKGGAPVHIVDQDIVVQAETQGLSKFYAHLNLSGTSTAASAEATPDHDGIVRVELHLPEANTIYFVEGSGVPIVAPTPGEGNLENQKGELVIYAGSFRVMFVEEQAD